MNTAVAPQMVNRSTNPGTAAGATMHSAVDAAPRADGHIRIVISDHQCMFRQGLRRVLETVGDFDLVADASEGGEAVQQCLKTQTDILLLDIPTLRVGGFEVLSQLSIQAPQVKTLLLATNIDQESLIQALRLGAKGAVSKEEDVDFLINAIRCVNAGGYWVDRRTLAAWAHSSQSFTTSECGFTRRELQIIFEIAAGASNRDIGNKLSISVETVKRHLSNIYKKSGVSNRVELAIYAFHSKLFE